MYFCCQRLKCGVAQTTVSSQMETIGIGTIKMFVLMVGVTHIDRASGIMRFVYFSKLCAIFWRIMRQKSRIMSELCELHNIFKRKFLMFQFIKLANQVSKSK